MDLIDGQLFLRELCCCAPHAAAVAPRPRVPAACFSPVCIDLQHAAAAQSLRAFF